MSIELSDVEKIFPEVIPSMASGHMEFVVHCPRFHKKGGRYKMSINADTGAYICHDCGHTGSANRDFFDKSSQFFAGMKINRAKVEHNYANDYWAKKEIWADDIPSPGKMVEISTLNEGHPVWEYLNSRGIASQDVSDFGLKYCTAGNYNFSAKMGTTAGRIIFPVVMAKKLVGWQARQIERVEGNAKLVWQGEDLEWRSFGKITSPDDGSWRWEDAGVPKYYTCPGMQRSRALFNFDKAKLSKGYVIVTEGPVDALKVGSQAVATFGKKLTRDQIRILSSNWPKILMILDSEIDTEEEWFKRLEESFSGVYLICMKLDGFHDAGEATRDEIWNQITNKYGDVDNYHP